MTKSKRVAITGAASGLGKALALHYARAGWKVALVDQNEERGKATAEELRQLGAEAFFLAGDVRQLATFETLRDELLRRWSGLDVLINNAGVAAHGAVDAAPLEDWEWIVDINLMGVVRACKVFIPLFKQQASGQIINIASMAGLLAGPEMGSYCASKAAVVSLSETLYAELKPLGIGVTVVCPAFFQTNLFESLRSPDPSAPRLVAKLLASSRRDATAIAARIYDKAASQTFMVTTHPSYTAFWYLKRGLPALHRSLTASMSHRLLKGRQQRAQGPAKPSTSQT